MDNTQDARSIDQLNMYAQQQDPATMNARSARDFLQETMRRREEIIESLRRPSITPIIQPTPPPSMQMQKVLPNEMEVDVPPEKRFEMVEDRFQGVDSRLRRIEAAIIQNNIGGIDLETLNRVKRELQKIKLQYIQTTTQTEEIINKLLQENQHLRSKLMNAEEENEHLKALDDDEYPSKRRRMSFDSYVPIRRVSIDSMGDDDSSTSQQGGVGFQVQSPPRIEVTYPTGYNPLKRRFSVSSESFHPDQVHVEAKIIPKSEESKKSIRDNIKHNLLFKNLSEDRIEEVVNAMTEVKYLPNDTVIKEGDDGENMYVIDQGELNVLYAAEIVATLGPGKAFGEIALMYNCPRTATIKAKTECKLWAMDRNTFRRILMQDSIRRRALYESFLAKVPIFQESLLPYERSKVADALEPVSFNDGEVIIREGDTNGDKFYIIEKGEVVCTKTSTDKSTSVEALRLKDGEYFGELSLLLRQPRQATVTACGPVKCLAISRDHFVQVMGPCEEILKRNMKNYATYEELIKQSKSQSAKEAANSDKENDPTNKDHHDRMSLVNDLIATENRYLEVCNKIIKGYLQPMRAQTDLKITKEEIIMVFANIEDILKLHEEFVQNLEKNKKDLFVGELMAQFAVGLKIYELYVKNYFNSLFLRNKNKSSPAHNKFLKARQADPAVGGVDLDKLLDIPFHRLPKYTKLVKQMLNLTDDKHPDRPYLQMAMKNLLELENTLEKSKRKLERLYNIQNNISGEHENFVDPRRQLKREEELTAINDNEKMKSYFFTDLIVFTKTIDVGGGEYKEVHFKTIPLNECQIAKGEAGVRVIWKNRNGKTESLDFSIQTPQMKSWAEDIERAVAELQR